MCYHNGRLDESFCVKCCFGEHSEIDYGNLFINDAGNVESKALDNTQQFNDKVNLIKKGDQLMKKPKRDDLVRQVMAETGLTGDKKTPTYFTRNQLLDLLAIIRGYRTQLQKLTVAVEEMKSEVESMYAGEIDNDDIEDTPGS